MRADLDAILFDWDGTLVDSLGAFQAANGAVMRTSALGAWDYTDAERVRHNAEQACLLTHADPRCVGSCVAVCLAIRALLQGERDVDAITAAALAAVKDCHPEMEEYFRRAMLLSRGDPRVFIERPISLGLLITTALLLILMALPSIKKARQEAFQEEG